MAVGNGAQISYSDSLQLNDAEASLGQGGVSHLRVSPSISGTGRDFVNSPQRKHGLPIAARHAECVFVTGPTPHVVGQLVKETRACATQYGRHPENLLFFMYLKVITGATETDARRKYNEFLEQVNYDGALALLSGWSGIDCS